MKHATPLPNQDILAHPATLQAYLIGNRTTWVIPGGKRTTSRHRAEKVAKRMQVLMTAGERGRLSVGSFRELVESFTAQDAR
jgi:hypothetical protein